MAILLDAAVVIIFVVTCITGYVMGFFKYAAMMLRTVATIIIAGLIAFSFATPAYNAFARDKAVKSIEEKIEKIDIVSIMEKIDIVSIMETDLRKKGLPLKVTNDDLREVVLADGDVVKNMRSMMGNKGVDISVVNKVIGDFENYLDNELFGKILKLTSDSQNGKNSFMNIGLENERKELVKFVKLLIPTDKHAAAMKIEENYVRPFGKLIAGAIVFVIAAVVVFAALIVVIKITDLLSKIKVVSAANSFGGLGLGVLKGIAYVLVIAYVLSLIVEESKDQLGKLNTTIIDNTYLFKYFFRIFYR